MLTEHEAWVEVGRMFEGRGRLPWWKYAGRRVLGICEAVWVLRDDRRDGVTMEVAREMTDRLKLFDGELDGGRRYKARGEWMAWYYWPRASRKPRAVACGLLAAMTEGR